MKEKIQTSLNAGMEFQVKTYAGESYEVKDPSQATAWESCLVLFSANGLPHLLPYEKISEVIGAAA